MDEKRLERIESKLDQVLEGHSNRLTKLETQTGHFQWAIALIFTSILGFFIKGK